MADPKDMWQCQMTNCGYIYNPDKGDRKGKIPSAQNLKICPTTGVARYAAHPKKHSNSSADIFTRASECPGARFFSLEKVH